MTSTRTLSQKVSQTVLFSVAIAALLGLAGCGKKNAGTSPGSIGPTVTAPTVTGPPTASLTADPLAIDIGQSIVLNWRTSTATSAMIDGIGTVNVNGTQTVSPSNSTIFHLTAKGDQGTAEANVRVTVRVPHPPDVPADVASDGTDMGDTGGFKVNVQDAFFDYDSYELRPDAQAAALKAASYLVSHPDIRIVIGGYCDDRGSAEYNLALGENRANAAKTALTNAGVAPARIRVVSFGKEKQFCTEETEACWQENRRAQFLLDR